MKRIKTKREEEEMEWFWLFILMSALYPLLTFLFVHTEKKNGYVLTHLQHVVHMMGSFFLFVIVYIREQEMEWVYGISIFFVIILFLRLFLIDVIHRKLPNIYIGWLVLLGFLFLFLENSASFWEHLLHAFLLFFSFLCIYVLAKGSVGAGDVKLSFVIGLFLPLSTFFSYLILTFGLATLYPFLFLAFQKEKDSIAFGPFMIFSYFLFFFVL